MHDTSRCRTCGDAEPFCCFTDGTDARAQPSNSVVPAANCISKKKSVESISLSIAAFSAWNFFKSTQKLRLPLRLRPETATFMSNTQDICFALRLLNSEEKWDARRHNARSVESAECGRFVIRSESGLNDLLLSLVEKINTPVLADASLMSVDEDTA